MEQQTYQSSRIPSGHGIEHLITVILYSTRGSSGHKPVKDSPDAADPYVNIHPLVIDNLQQITRSSSRIASCVPGICFLVSYKATASSFQLLLLQTAFEPTLHDFVTGTNGIIWQKKGIHPFEIPVLHIRIFPDYRCRR